MPLTQFAYNSTNIKTIKVLLFYANYSFNPKAYQTSLPSKHLLAKAIVRANRLKALYNKLIINHLIKYIYILLYKEMYIVKNLTYTFFKTVLANYKLLKEIIFNKDKLFIFKF